MNLSRKVSPLIAPPKLLDQVSAVARLRHLSIRTEKAYRYHIKQFILFHNKRHPNEMREDEIRAYLTHLAVDRHVSASTQNVALRKLAIPRPRRLEVEQLDRIDDVERARLSTRLPAVFTREEVAAILHRLSGVPELFASLMYGSGLRLMECLRLRVKDIDFSYARFVSAMARVRKTESHAAGKLKEPLRLQLLNAKLTHQHDLKSGLGEVWLPYALAQKYQNAAREWGCNTFSRLLKLALIIKLVNDDDTT